MISLGNGERIEISKIKLLYPELKAEAKRKDDLIKEQEKKIRDLTKENATLKREIHQLKSVLDATNDNGVQMLNTIPEDSMTNLRSSELSTSPSKFLKVVDKVRNKRFAVSAESGDNAEEKEVVSMKPVPKDQNAKELIRKGIRSNNFLRHLEEAQVKEIISYMYIKTYRPDEYVIQEGENGSALFVMFNGHVQVSKGNDLLGKPLGAGVLFGELAILYNCTRTASVRALDDVQVWTIERSVYQTVMRKTGTVRRDEHHQFLTSVPAFQGLQSEKLFKIVDSAMEEFYHPDEYIVREGELGDSFFVIIQGTVRVMQVLEGKTEPQEIRKLSVGDYFGEKALLSEDVRTASIIAEKPGVKCLVIERSIFMSVIGVIKHIVNKDYGDQERKAVTAALTVESKGLRANSIRPEYKNVTLDQYKVLSTLGMGGFGRVELVQDKKKPEKTYALKCLSKKHIVDTKQQEHVQNERNVLLSIDTHFIIKLYRSFKDNKYVYLLMEVCLGGELWTILRDRNTFDEATSRFYVACVVEAFEYLHNRSIVFRDLKPENLLMDDKGYVKLVDFGFAKRLPSGKKTWTFCGTPEYVAPEIILNKGHDCSADYWSLGILIFELMTGNPPFASGDAMTTYNIILKGIDSLEFPSKITRNAQLIIKKFCRDNPSERLGNQKDGLNDVRKHKWFQGFHWAGLSSRSLRPPILPKIKGPNDTSNFDYFAPSKDKAPPDEMSGWDKDF